MGERVQVVSLRLYLVRHAESEWNRSSRYAGQQDVPLSTRGKEQANRIARRLSQEHLDALYASPLQRARETASIVGKACNVSLTVDPDLAEIHHGEWEGLTTLQVHAAFPSEYERWLSHPDRAIMPGGETLDQVSERVRAAFSRIQQKHANGKVGIFSHDAVLRVLLLRCLGLELEHFWKWELENASVSMVDVTEKGKYRLVCLNDTSHLDGIHSEYALQAL